MARKSTTSKAKAAKGGTGKANRARTTKPRVRLVGRVTADQVEDAKRSVQAGVGKAWDAHVRARMHKMLDEMSPAEVRDLFAEESESTPASIVEFWRTGAGNADAGGRRHVLARAKSLLDRVPTRYVEAWLDIFQEYAVEVPNPDGLIAALTERKQG